MSSSFTVAVWRQKQQIHIFLNIYKDSHLVLYIEIVLILLSELIKK